MLFITPVYIPRPIKVKGSNERLRLVEICILVVDDEWAIVDLLKNVIPRLLATCGHQCLVISASGVEEAKDQLGLIKPNLVLTDFIMPDGSGLDLLDFIRGSDDLKEVKVVIITGTVDELQKDLRENMPDEVMAKPIELSFLRQTILRVLGIDQQQASATPTAPTS